MRGFRPARAGNALSRISRFSPLRLLAPRLLVCGREADVADKHIGDKADLRYLEANSVRCSAGQPLGFPGLHRGLASRSATSRAS